MSCNKPMFCGKHLSSAIAALLLLLTACGIPPTATQPAVPDTYPVPGDSTTPTQVPQGEQGPSVTLDPSGVAGSFTSQVVAAVSPEAGGPYWEAMPEHLLVTLVGYPISDHIRQPQVFLYPVDALKAAYETAGQVATDLQALLQTRQAGEQLPSLPLINAAQMFYAQVAPLDFKNGSGVRYLAQLAQGIVPVNNHELIYTYQGLTADDRYYVAAVLPVTLPGLPVDATLTGQEPPEFTSAYATYLEDIAALLDEQHASAFTPDLSALDAMIRSIEINK